MIAHRNSGGRIEVVCPKCGEWGMLSQHRMRKGNSHYRYLVSHVGTYGIRTHAFGWTTDEWDVLEQVYRIYVPNGEGREVRRRKELERIKRELLKRGEHATIFERVIGSSSPSTYVLCPRCGALGTIVGTDGYMRVHHGNRRYCYFGKRSPETEWLLAAIGGKQ